ncbi:helix-turn-helix transcriptional regulator [Pelosinus propionicus]|uniref:Helix-turn-helix domain-containing protein n=1 Tax=Pelosinus propionicus DSM 13327 TaxID=1123291 RepID=A0A1I4QHI7_9FIRM|nr:helix-turn-helix domain-containing protein [Pelosinus propionicus]SFM39236.1 Helix-turn-helix domain-containing protein [Pelosinus propionicus DSM 13327]
MKYVFDNREALEKFIQEELINTADVMQILNCSRQNVFDLIKRKKITPVKETSKERLFLKSDILARLKQLE